MDTLACVSPCHSVTLSVTTDYHTQFVDLTERLQDLVRDSGLLTGILNVQSLHTTTAVVVNEHEPLLLADFCERLERFAPAGIPYRHDDHTVRTVNLTAGERVNGFAHCRALVMPPSVCLNVVDGALRLGRWQRVFLVELDGPQRRTVSVLVMGDGVRA
jgi:secondary thiamine-phosphate synthase enzyme